MKEDILFEKLKKYSEKDIYPFHMPGHKRNPAFSGDCLPVKMDITEINGFDNLHQAEGVILEARRQASALFGSEKAYLSVNGSTGLILAAVSAAVRRGGRILMARNCHRSVYHAVYLRDLKPAFIYPETDLKYGIEGDIIPEKVSMLLKKYPDAEAVIITSPTYHGIVSNIREISMICHKKGIPLIVDEAHGAHFSFSDYFPESAVSGGADLVIHSTHKTLFSLTQTAIMHQCSDLIKTELLERFLRIYQSSSPSYILMASLSLCMDILSEKKEELFNGYVKRLERARKRLSVTENIRLVEPEMFSFSPVFDYDRSKLIISCADTGMSGPEFHNLMRGRYRMEMEMTGPAYILAMSSAADTEEGFERLITACEETDRKGRPEEKTEKETYEYEEEMEPVLSVREALEGNTWLCPLTESSGKICAEFVAVYPPGIPLIIPGERISDLFIEKMNRYYETGLEISGLEKKERLYIPVTG